MPPTNAMAVAFVVIAASAVAATTRHHHHRRHLHLAIVVLAVAVAISVAASVAFTTAIAALLLPLIVDCCPIRWRERKSLFFFASRFLRTPGQRIEKRYLLGAGKVCFYDVCMLQKLCLWTRP